MDSHTIPAGKKTGLIPRNYRAYPVGYLASAPAFPRDQIIEKAERLERFKEHKAKGLGLLALRERNYEHLKSLDQDGYGYCWAFSSTKAVMYVRAINNQPPVRLSAWAVAAIIKNYRDQGGWGAESLAFIVKHGVPSLEFWPQQAVNPRYDTAEMRANAALHKVEEWWDGSDDPDEAKAQMETCLLLGIPCVVDLNVMGHSMCAIDFGDTIDEIIYDNSWGEGGEKGLYRGRGRYSRPDGLVIPRVVSGGVA